jgi:hypothetical protein
MEVSRGEGIEKKSRFSSGMTEERAKATANADSLRE